MQTQGTEDTHNKFDPWYRVGLYSIIGFYIFLGVAAIDLAVNSANYKTEEIDIECP